VILNPEKRKVGSSILPLTTTLTCADVRLVITKAQLVTLVVSFSGHLLQADGRFSAHSRRSQAHPSNTVGLGSALVSVTSGEQSLSREAL
jgi:hypothetical protein